MEKEFLDPDVDDCSGPGSELSEEQYRILHEHGMLEELERQVEGEPMGTVH